ncbi:MAG: DUF1501 domain-containing protein [Pseudomonadota bacterium]
MKRRDFLRKGALLPALPALSALAPAPLWARIAAQEPLATSGRRLLLIRLAGGNDGLNTLVPFRNDVYYRSRPSIALGAQKLLSLDGRDSGLHPALVDFKQLMDEGSAGIIQSIGYPRASRSHRRATEIWATGTTERPVPDAGWLGRWADGADRSAATAGFTLGDDSSGPLRSSTGRTETIAHPEALRALLNRAEEAAPTGSAVNEATQLTHLRQLEGRVRAQAVQFDRASTGSGSRYHYPDTEFGAALRWTANLIETESTAQVFHVTLGSFERGFSFDTHLHQLAAHEALYAEFGGGVRALAAQLKAVGAWDDTLVMTYSDFGRQIAENNTGGTEHGDAGVMFLAGGRVAAGVHGDLPELTGSRSGGVMPQVDFRGAFATVLDQWLGADATAILGTSIDPYPVLA